MAQTVYNWFDTINNRLISQQLNYNHQAEHDMATHFIASLNSDQQHVFKSSGIPSSINKANFFSLMARENVARHTFMRCFVMPSVHSVLSSCASPLQVLPVFCCLEVKQHIQPSKSPSTTLTNTPFAASTKKASVQIFSTLPMQFSMMKV